MAATDLEAAARPETTDGWGPWSVPVAILVGVALAAGLVLRFVTRSPLWLDESLSVNIARLPLGDIGEALRHDGHPPLYYVLLHGWMDVFGTGNGAVRAFSGLWSVAAFPLMWVAARRLGGRRVAMYALVLLALSPYAVRYATETRMYAMEMTLSLAGWLLVVDALRRPLWWRLGAVALVVGALLWTHYWAMWFLFTGGVALLIRAWRARRAGRPDKARASLMVAGAIAAGGVLFLPWVPSLLYQGTRTGTPWARPLRPTEMVTNTLADLGGGAQSEAVILGWGLAVLAAIGLSGRAVDRYRIEFDVRTTARGRPLALLIAGTLAIACLVGYATGATYATRYASIFVPYLFVLAALGLDQVRSRPLAVGALAFLVVFGGVASARNAVTDRSDGVRSSDVIEERGRPGDLVAYCPDQLGPSTSRALGTGYDQVTYPRFKRPQRVDWVDYNAVLDRASPEGFAVELLRRAGPRRIFLVFDTRYLTHRESCRKVYNTLGKARPPETLSDPSGAFEPATVAVFEPVPPPPT